MERDASSSRRIPEERHPHQRAAASSMWILFCPFGANATSATPPGKFTKRKVLKEKNRRLNNTLTF